MVGGSGNSHKESDRRNLKKEEEVVLESIQKPLHPPQKKAAKISLF